MLRLGRTWRNAWRPQDEILGERDVSTARRSQHPNGATIVIPPRPFLHPVMYKLRKQIVEHYREAIRAAL